jgi:hypothetical protein
VYICLSVHSSVQLSVRPSSKYLSISVRLSVFSFCVVCQYACLYIDLPMTVGLSACPLSFLFSVVLFVPLSLH